jgi:hypothetical protein
MQTSFSGRFCGWIEIFAHLLPGNKLRLQTFFVDRFSQIYLNFCFLRSNSHINDIPVVTKKRTHSRTNSANDFLGAFDFLVE